MTTAFILIVVAVAGYFDARWRRVPNWLAGSTLLISLVWHGAASGPSGLRASAAGAAVALGVLFPLFVLRGLGAGDVKFASALGAALTIRLVPPLLFLTLVVSALMALVEVARRRALRQTAQNIAALARGWARGRLGPHETISIDSPDAIPVPFTLSAAIATCLILLGGAS